MRSWRWYSKVLFALLVVAFAYWVWPTPWRYDHTQVGRLHLPVRTHRITGRAEMLSGTTWEQRKPPKQDNGDHLDILGKSPEKDSGVRRDYASEEDAISIVKGRPGRDYFDFAPGGRAYDVEWCVRNVWSSMKGPQPPLLWKAEKHSSGLYVVSVGGMRGDRLVSIYGWEVDVENRVVRFLNDDPELAKSYGFKGVKLQSK